MYKSKHAALGFPPQLYDKSALLVLLVCTAHACSAEDCGCNNPVPANAVTCQILMRNFEKALTSNDCTSANDLLPASAERPELVNVTYRLQFASSATNLPNCSCGAATNTTNRRVFIEPGRTLTVRYVWTIVGLYTLIHPALLNQLQFPLPFSIMRLVTADNVPFLWNGYHALPSAEVELNIDTGNLTCLPDTQQVDETMKTITSLVSCMLISDGILTIVSYCSFNSILSHQPMEEGAHFLKLILLLMDSL